MNKIAVFDGHNDTLLNLHLPDRGEGRSFFERSELGHVDLPRAREGGFGGGFFACYTPNPEDDGWTEESAFSVTEDGYEVSGAPPLDPEYAHGFADGLVKDLFRLEEESGGSLRVVRTADQLEGASLPPTVRRVQQGLSTPYVYYAAFSVERQLPRNTTGKVLKRELSS